MLLFLTLGGVSSGARAHTTRHADLSEQKRGRLRKVPI